MARPKLVIDEKVVETLAKVGATNCEIADHFACDEGTIRNRFSEILTKARATRKIRLRQMQWGLAEKGNLGMLIWLGKQELGQAEKIDQKSQNIHLIEQAQQIASLPKEELLKIIKEETRKIKDE
jgi:hypothetical protein